MQGHFIDDAEFTDMGLQQGYFRGIAGTHKCEGKQTEQETNTEEAITCRNYSHMYHQPIRLQHRNQGSDFGVHEVQVGNKQDDTCKESRQSQCHGGTLDKQKSRQRCSPGHIYHGLISIGPGSTPRYVPTDADSGSMQQEDQHDQCHQRNDSGFNPASGFQQLPYHEYQQ